MSSPFASIDAATIAALNGGSEQALEQVFRAHYAWLMEKALERLKGEDAAAPKLIVNTVVEFWQEREGFHSAAEIEAFFNEELRHRARAVRARMAAVHRFEKAEGVHTPPQHSAPSADAIWGEIAAELHRPVVDPATAAKRRREQTSHDVAQHITTVTKRGDWKTPTIIITVATIIALAGGWWMSQRSRAEVINQLLGSADARMIDTRGGQMGSVELNDKSIARLAPDTRLMIVPRFGAEYRTLTVTGAASFSVAPGNPHAFEARLGDVSVFATGGAFTVRGYPEDARRVIRADTGELRVRIGTEERTLAAGEALRIARDGSASTPTVDEQRDDFAWTEGRLVIADASVTDVLQAFRRWYAIDLALTDSSTATRVVSIDVPLESSQAAIAALEAAAQLKFAWVGTRMTLQPAAAPRGR